MTIASAPRTISQTTRGASAPSETRMPISARTAHRAEADETVERDGRQRQPKPPDHAESAATRRSRASDSDFCAASVFTL